MFFLFASGMESMCQRQRTEITQKVERNDSQALAPQPAFLSQSQEKALPLEGHYCVI